MFSLNWLYSVAKIFVRAVKGFKHATSCVRDHDATTVWARHVRDRIFKLTPIHASVIYQNRRICWISTPFRENSIVYKILHQSVRPIFFENYCQKSNKRKTSPLLISWKLYSLKHGFTTSNHLQLLQTGTFPRNWSALPVPAAQVQAGQCCVYAVYKHVLIPRLRAKTLQSDVCHPRCGDLTETRK